jgi:hypothetical protein
MAECGGEADRVLQTPSDCSKARSVVHVPRKTLLSRLLSAMLTSPSRTREGKTVAIWTAILTRRFARGQLFGEQGEASISFQASSCSSICAFPLCALCKSKPPAVISSRGLPENWKKVLGAHGFDGIIIVGPY